MALPKWTEERTEALVAYVGDESPVSQATVAGAAEEFETTPRSISSKLRKMDYEVESVASAATPSFTEAQTEQLRNLLEQNSGVFTFAELAEQLGEGFTAKKVQGKVLSMQLNEHVRPTPKPEVVRSYSEEETARFVELVNEGSFIEDIAAEFGREVASIRGKALSLYRSGDITAMPKQREAASTTKADPFEALSNVAEMTVEEIAEALGKTPRGVKTMLTRRGITASDYDGAAKKAKAQA
jgi:transposase-like protein